MKQLLDKLSEVIEGEITTNDDDLRYYSTDGSVFKITPSAIVYPKDTNDVSKLVETTYAANKLGGDKVSLTARGNGTDQGGGPLNSGIIVDFMKHMNQILEIGEDFVVVQPGCLYGRLQKELKNHGRYLPPYPASIEVSTIGGAVANNAAGEKTVKYGATRQYVEALQVVLADGSVTWVYPMNRNQVDVLKQSGGLEADIYTQIDELISKNREFINSNHPHVTKESAGYAVWKVENDNGTFDLSELITGSQGTLCFVTAIRLHTLPTPDPEKIALLVSYYNNIEEAGRAARELHALEPSALEIVDSNLINLVNKQKPELLVGLLPEGDVPAIVLLSEFDDQDDEIRQQKIDQAQAVIDKHAYQSVVRKTSEEEARSWKLRRSAAAVMWTIPGTKKALPIIEDGTVPPEKLSEFIERAYEIFKKYNLEIAIWGHAGDADLHMQPFMDLSQETDRERLFQITDEFYGMVKELGGTAAGEHNDSIMRAVYQPLIFGDEMVDIFNQIKHIFDSENMFNPHKKVGVDFNYAKAHLRHDYSIESLAKMEREKARDKIDR